MTLLEKIPTVVTVGVLVVIFFFLKRHARSVRLNLWMTGWMLVFIHFLAQLMEPSVGDPGPHLLALDMGSLQAAAIAFMVSVSIVVGDSRRRKILLVVAGVPSVLYAIVASYDVHARWPYVTCLVACFGGASAFIIYVYKKLTWYTATMVPLCLLVMAWATRAALHGSFDEGLTAFLTLGFGLPGFFLCKNYWRPSAGIVTVAGGFFCWGAVFPIGMLTDRFLPTVVIPPELWNTPKLFVALGMILAIVEDKSESIERMQSKERALNRQLERFSAITSRLLGGASVDSLCNEIANAITEVTTFEVAAIHLEHAGHLRVAGASGLAPKAFSELQDRAKAWRVDDITDFCSHARKLGQNSYLLSRREAEKYDPVKSTRVYDPNPYWNSGDELLIPLSSPRGACMGCLALDDPRDVTAVNAHDISRIELLAADLAVALELKSLQSQLVRSEKLAALGQLVAGVAHELNNPLTSVMGYGELLADEMPPGPTRDRLEKLANEARRMKRIVENLLRFSRQRTADRQPVELPPVIEDVLALREYYIRTRNLGVVIDIEPDLPHVAVDEDQFKQILLNLINNAIDAVETVPEPRRIIIRALRRGNRANIEIEDSGPGFADVNRAFDPFYTTKPVGKGTGLGLSICYGIIKEHEGEIRLENLQPKGARVTVELPLAAKAARA
jgi:signal transduction histidine kinase